MKNIFTIIIALTLSLTSYGQKYFEGEIRYSLESTGNSQDKSDELPDEIISYFKEGKMRCDVITPEVSLHIITNEESQNATFMVEIKGDFALNFALNTNIEALKKEFTIETTPKVRYTRETKKIAGYRCKKAIITADDGEVYAYTTEEINAKNLNWLLNDEIKGTLLEFIIASNDDSENIILKATEIRSTKVADSRFDVPSGYISISVDGLKDMFGEGGMF